MPEKRFRDIQGDDPRLQERYLADHDQQPPDNFIESAEGGGVNTNELAEETDTEEFKTILDLETHMRKLKPGILKDDEPFRYQ
jgi:hypothetical protein